MNTTIPLDLATNLTMLPAPPVAANDPARDLPGADESYANAIDDQESPKYRKIAKLPRSFRDRINIMLDDGLAAREIIESLQQSTDPPLPYPISATAIARWRDTGYRRYLAQQERLALFQSNCEGAHDIISSDDTTTLPEATLQIIASQYFEFVGDFSPEALKAKLAEEPVKYTRFLAVFARLVREILNLKKYRDATAKAAAAELKELDPDRELNDREQALLDKKWNTVFKVSCTPLSPPGTPPPSTKNAWPQPAASDQAITPPPPVMPGAPKSPKVEPFKNYSPPGSNEKRPVPQATPPALPLPNSNAGPPAIPAPPMLVMPNNAATAPVQVIKSLAPPVIQVPTPPVIEVPAPPSSSASPSSSPAAACAPEFCPSCQALLPELLPTGERPFPGCWRCGQPLLEPNTEFCPGCRTPLPKLAPNGQRPHVDCRHCGTILPPATAAPS